MAVKDARPTAKTPAKTLPDWSVRKLQLALRGDSQGGAIPGHQGLTEGEMADAMNRCRLAAAEITLAAKTLTTSGETTEWRVHPSPVDSLRKALVDDFGGKVLADKIRPDPRNRGKNCVAEIVLKQGAQLKKQRAL